MGYCQDFDHDIFISYAHVNNADKWVDDLLSALELRLPELIYQAPRIWKDDKGGLDGKTIDGGITTALENSAVLLAVVSGAFLHSTYCVPIELESFRHPHFPPVIRNVSRIQAVVYDMPEDYPTAKWPKSLQDVQWVRFDSPAGPYLRPARRDPASPYWQSMEDLVRKIMTVLRELKKGLGGAEVATLEPPAVAPATKPVSKTAYQAVWKPNVHVTYDVKDKGRADQLKTELASHCELVTGLPHDSTKERRLRYLQNADGHILLFNHGDVDWAEDLVLESVTIAPTQGRPKLIGLANDNPDELDVHSPMIAPIGSSNDGLKSFVSALKEIS